MGKSNFKIITHKNEEVHSICFALILPIGAINDPVGKAGITHLIEHMSFRKAGILKQKEIYSKCEELGVFIHAVTGKNFLQYDFICRKEVFSEMISIFDKMLNEIDYSEEDLMLEKKVVLAEISRRVYSYSEKLTNYLWNEENYSNIILGTKESVQNITLEDIISFKKHILSHEGIIFLVGNFGENDFKIAENISTKSLNIKKEQSFNTIKKNISKINFFKDKGNYCDIYYAFHFDLRGKNKIKNIILMQMLESILFEGNAAYLKEVMREEKGYVYEFDSYINIIGDELVFLFNYEIDKLMSVDSIKELEKNLSKFTVNEKYLRYIKAFHCDNYDMIYDNIYDLFYDYIKNYLYFGDVISPKEYSDIVLKLISDDFSMFFSKMSKEKKVFVCGELNKSQKKEISLCLI